jgi:hypothetical protein
MMLIYLAQQVRQAAADVAQREQLQTQLISIQQTQQRASEVLSQALSVVKSLQAVRDLLSVTEQNLVQQRTRSLNEQTLKVISDLAQNPRQIEPLGGIRQGFDDLEKGVLTPAWQRYAKQNTSRRRELFALIQYLPEFADHRGTISSLIAQLDADSVTLPKDARRREQFEQRLKTVDDRFSVLEIPDAIRAFLQRVLLQTATVSDISDEVLAWLREGGHSSAFRISFK